MDRKNIFKIWAKSTNKWSAWVRPVPFMAINNSLKLYETNDFVIHNISYLKDMNKDTAIIVDLPSDYSIKEGLALAKIGYIPIPIYNGTIEQVNAMSTVDNTSLLYGIIKGACILKDLEISDDASPAFLVDTNRMNRYKMNVSVFDNSYDTYPQDLPSSKFFLENGINKIIIRSDKVQSDLNKILYKFQREGIKIYFTNGFENIKEVILKNPKDKEK